MRSDEVFRYQFNGAHKAWDLPKESARDSAKVHTVRNTQEICKAVRAAALESGTQLLVKNTGHDYLGRGVINTLNIPTIFIFTHEMNGICWSVMSDTCDRTCFTDEERLKTKGFVSCSKNKLPILEDLHLVSKEEPFGYYNAEAGCQWYQIFSMVEIGNHFWAIKGGSNTVGAVGGWLLDGGFSMFPKLFGMGIDNILHMHVVLPDGREFDMSEKFLYEIVNDKHQLLNQQEKVVPFELVNNVKNDNKKLHNYLWLAMRGGGGGNYGILVDATYRLHAPLENYYSLHLPHLEVPEHRLPELFGLFFGSKRQIHWAYMTKCGGMIQAKSQGLSLFLSFANISEEQLNTIKGAIFLLCETFNCSHTMSLLDDDTFAVNYSSQNMLYFWKTHALSVERIHAEKQLHLDADKKETDDEIKKNERWYSYQSFDDYIVKFGSAYLKHTINDIPGKLCEVLENVAMIQIEISKGLYAEDDDDPGGYQRVLSNNKKTVVHPVVRESIGLMYIRAYMSGYTPYLNTIASLKKVTIKYDRQRANDLQGKLQKSKTAKEALRHIERAKEQLYNSTQSAVENMYRLFGTDTYVNHSDSEIKTMRDFGKRLWGENYEKLVVMKKVLDPVNRLKNDITPRSEK